MDISNPADYIVLSSYVADGYNEDIVVQNGKAYVVSQRVMDIVDISNPTNPTRLGRYDDWGLGIDVVDNIAYVAGNGLQLIDVSNPADPTLIGKYEMEGNAYDVVVVGNIAYVASEHDSEDDYYSSMDVVDVSNPAAPTLIGRYKTKGYGAHGVFVAGNIAYVVDEGNGLLLLDVSNPAVPRLIASYDTDDTYDVVVMGNTAYVATDRGLKLLDVSNPNKPELILSYGTPSRVRSVHVMNDLIYIVSSGGLQILRLSDSPAPVQPTPTTAPMQPTSTPMPTATPTPTPKPPTGISGTVTNADGSPLTDVYVQAYKDGNAVAGTGTRTASDGSYRLTLPAGTYNVSFFDLNRKHPSEYYDSAEQLAQAKDVVVPEGTIVPNIDASLRNPLAPLANVPTHCGAISHNPQTGGFFMRQASGSRCDTTIQTTITCEGNTMPVSVTLHVGTATFPMLQEATGDDPYAPDESTTYMATVPADDVQTGQVRATWVCDETPQDETLGAIHLYDPSGLITDVDSGKPISNAIVLLHRVPDWRARTDANDTAPQTCESNNSKAAGAAWSQTAPVTQGIFVDANLMALSATQEISPVVNPQITGADGYYGWDVAAGCWYIEVQAEGYKRVYSPVVGVPPEVTDLHIALGIERFVYLPLITRR